MADPVSALAAVGTASSFIQVIDFSVKVLINAGKLLRDNKLNDIAPLTALNERCADISRLLQEDHKRPLSESDTNMDTLAIKCQDASGELLKMLSGLKLDDTTNPVKKAAKAVKIAGKAAWKKEEIESKQKHIQELNGMLGTAILTSLRKTQIAFQEELFEQMSQDTQSILQAVRTATSSVTDEAKRQIAKAARIANSLKFPEMLRRKDNVPQNFESTFEWIFDDQQCSFSQWLKDGDGVFWVSGKAGSGKSTLMKFLTAHNTTEALCKQWSGVNNHLVRADFYFWFSGSPMQKSALGLLQSILYQIFQGCPDLVRRVCPARWSCDDFDMLETYPWAEDELEEALRLAAAEKCNVWVGEKHNRREVSVRYVFFIDGLDEYAGNHRELAELVTSLGLSCHLKLCISSRPWTHFSNAFQQPGKYMRLEDHTGPDIAAYVRGQLKQAEKKNRHHHKSLSKGDAVNLLIKTIIEKANGVFIWVYLVVRSVWDGIANGDSMALLQQRVLDLPSELKDYFSLMLQRLDVTYRRLTAQVLHLVYLASVDSERDPWLVSFIDLWPLHEQPNYFEDENFHLEGTHTEVQSDELRDMLLDVTRKVRTWCRDFLYVPATQAIGQSDSDLDLIRFGRIEFLHRTVYDFLVTEEVQASMKHHLPEHFYNSRLARQLALARLRLVPVAVPHQACQWYSTESPKAVFMGPPPLDGSFVEMLRRVDEYGAQYSTMYCGSKRYACPIYTLNSIRLSQRGHFVLGSELAARGKLRTGLADHLLTRYLERGRMLSIIEFSLEFVRRLFEAGADINIRFDILFRDNSIEVDARPPTLWGELISTFVKSLMDDTQRKKARELIELCLEYGADPEVQLSSALRKYIKSFEAALTPDSRPLRLREAVKSIVPDSSIDKVDLLIKQYSSISARVEASERLERLRRRDKGKGAPSELSVATNENHHPLESH